MSTYRDALSLKPLSIKSIGRAHLACLRCRSQKIKCSGDMPCCRNCSVSNKECNYPQRERKVTCLESQLTKIQEKLQFLENRVKEYEEHEKQVKMLQSQGVECMQDRQQRLLPTLQDITTEELPEQELVSPEEDELQPLQSSNDNDDGSIAPFSKNSNVEEKRYFGTASGQRFDSELKSYLFAVAHEEDRRSSISQQRHFFKDPTLESPFSGVVMLPSKEYALKLVDKVVSFLGREYYFFDTKLFYKQIDEAYEKLRDKKPTWLCYFLITLAVGEQYLNESPSGEIPGMRFYIASMRLYKSSYEEPTLEFVQMLLLIAYYLQGLNSANAAFSFYGLASRSALIQGLHRRSHNLSPVDAEKRKRLWWTVFVMESIWCSNLGHPIHVGIEDADVELPDENIVGLGDGFNSELLGYNVKLGIILGNVMRKLYRPAKGSVNITIRSILDCLHDLDDFQVALPVRIKNNLILSDNRSTANLYLRMNHDIIITTRPLLLSLFKGHIRASKTSKKVINRCISAARLNIDILVTLKSNEWFSTYGFWDAQFLFSALIILIIGSLSGHEYPQIALGRKMNTYMQDAGNFTAKDNELRLAELDDLLSKVPSRNILTSPSLNPTENSCYQTGGPVPATSNFLTNFENGTPSLESYNSSHHPSLSQTNIDGLLEGPSLEQAPGVSDTSPGSDVGQIGDFSTFRNNVSPDTWNILTTNLQFWNTNNSI